MKQPEMMQTADLQSSTGEQVNHIYSEKQSTDVHLICIIGIPLTFLDCVEGPILSP